MSKGRYHWPPREGDRVYQQSRADQEEWPHGEIVMIERDWSNLDSSTALVKFFAHKNIIQQHGENVLVYDGSLHWKLDQGMVWTPENDWSELDQSKFSYLFTGEEYSWGGCDDLKTIWFEDFEGNWSSSDGGNARWEIT